ncbi:hypothetical protein [Cloacibacterium normanense]|mgnify:CR=1 FL=1
MKKVIGWLLAILGVANIFKVGYILSNATSDAVRVDWTKTMIFAIGLTGLGIYLIASASKKDDNEENLPKKEN